jgi:hypothetical protein
MRSESSLDVDTEIRQEDRDEASNHPCVYDLSDRLRWKTMEDWTRP